MTHPTQNPSARRLSAQLLHQVLEKKHPLDAAFGSDRDIAALSPQDRAFTLLMVKTTLRRLGQIDAIIAQYLEHRLPETARMAQHILRLGAAQLLFMDTPSYAVVNSFVEESKSLGATKFSGLINAVLKRIDIEGRALLETQDAPKLNTPDWLWQSWSAAYGEMTARRIAQTNMIEPLLDIRVKDDPEGWAEKLGGELIETQPHMGQYVIRITNPSAPIEEMPGYDEGAWWVQDQHATVPADRLIQRLSQNGKLSKLTVYDLCAAPGGKTMQLAAAGLKVTAVDISESRMKRVKQNLKRTKLKAECITADITKWNPGRQADAILLDAPCSATGTLRRHPDAAWLRTPDDITRLALLQQKLLNHALEHLLKPGGMLLYSVCSLQPEEGEAQIERLCGPLEDAGKPNLDRRRHLPRFTWSIAERLLPDPEIKTKQGDGFFVALINKNMY